MKVTPINKKFGKYAPGDEFILPDKAANVLIRAGKLREVTREIVADQVIAAAPRAKRTYTRRDMRAES